MAMHLLLVQHRQNPDNLGNTDGWVVEQVTRDPEKVDEWHDQCNAALREDAIEAFMVVTTSLRYSKEMPSDAT